MGNINKTLMNIGNSILIISWLEVEVLKGNYASQLNYIVAVANIVFVFFVACND